ncbi:MAG: hypothetical protein MK033_06725 [Candidatus Caenarcaniphilales bacterium]|nr:hypothetical protein [Candidatus Caenarcaniphilales bacterium]
MLNGIKREFQKTLWALTPNKSKVRASARKKANFQNYTQTMHGNNIEPGSVHNPALSLHIAKKSLGIYESQNSINLQDESHCTLLENIYKSLSELTHDHTGQRSPIPPEAIREVTKEAMNNYRNINPDNSSNLAFHSDILSYSQSLANLLNLSSIHADIQGKMQDLDYTNATTKGKRKVKKLIAQELSDTYQLKTQDLEELITVFNDEKPLVNKALSTLKTLCKDFGYEDDRKMSHEMGKIAGSFAVINLMEKAPPVIQSTFPISGLVTNCLVNKGLSEPLRSVAGGYKDTFSEELRERLNSKAIDIFVEAQEKGNLSTKEMMTLDNMRKQAVKEIGPLMSSLLVDVGPAFVFAFSGALGTALSPTGTIAKSAMLANNAATMLRSYGLSSKVNQAARDLSVEKLEASNEEIALGLSFYDNGNKSKEDINGYKKASFETSRIAKKQNDNNRKERFWNPLNASPYSIFNGLIVAAIQKGSNGIIAGIGAAENNQNAAQDVKKFMKEMTREIPSQLHTVREFIKVLHKLENGDYQSVFKNPK